MITIQEINNWKFLKNEFAKTLFDPTVQKTAQVKYANDMQRPDGLLISASGNLELKENSLLEWQHSGDIIHMQAIMARLSLVRFHDYQTICPVENWSIGTIFECLQQINALKYQNCPPQLGLEYFYAAMSMYLTPFKNFKQIIQTDP